MLSFNNNQSTISSNLSLHDHFEPAFNLPQPTPFVPAFNIFSPLQSLLSILNFTSLFQESPYLDVYHNSTQTTSPFEPEASTSMILPHPTLYNLTPSPDADNITVRPDPFVNWEPEFSGNVSKGPESTEKSENVISYENTSVRVEQNPNLERDYYYIDNFHKFPKEIEDYGIITEQFSKPVDSDALNNAVTALAEFNASFIEPNINVSWQLDSINRSSWLPESLNDTSKGFEYDETVITIVTAVVLAFIILITVVGNVFVIAAILLEKNLQSVANYLILSLAVADLLVAALVMPLGAVYEVSKEWTLGPELCDMWTVSDVLCCTASILHLVAIALDRFWAVTNLDYIQQRSPKRVGTMIAIIWGVSTLISAAPLMGWKDTDWHGRIHNNKICLVSQDLYYQVFATMTSFYLPLGVILILYWRIYQAARKRIRRKVGARAQNALLRGAVAISETTTFTRVSSANESPEKSSNGAISEVPSDQRNEEVLRFKMAALPLNPLALLGARAPRKREMDARRERKAAKTLAVITGVFVICWLPFFVTALLMPLCTSCYFSPYLVATLLWLGYFNSTLNPIIYTIFSPDFRHAFRRILCGKRRLRKRQYDARVSSIKAAKS